MQKLAWGLMALVALGAAMPAAAEEQTSTAISEIRHETSERSTRLTVDCTGPVSYTYYSPDPLTLVVDIPEVDPSKVPAKINVGTPEVESLRVTGMVRGDGRTLARIEVRLASLTPFQIYSRDKALHMVFERGARAARPDAAPAASVEVAPAAAPAPAPDDKTAPSEVASAPAPAERPQATAAAD